MRAVPKIGRIIQSKMMRASALYSIFRFRLREPMPSNLPCTSFLVGWRGQMLVSFIPQHDEIIIEARDGIEDQVKAIVKGAMEEAFKQIIPEALFVAETRVAEAWGD